MKNIWYKVGIIAGIMIIGYLSFVLYFTKPQPVYIEKEPTEFINKAKTEAKKIANTVDKKGYSVAIFELKKSIIGNGDITGLPISQSVLDSLRLDNLEKDRRLQQASVVNGTLNAKSLKADRVIDSLKRETHTYKDQFLTATYYQDSLGGKFDINYKLSLIRQDYKKRKNIFSGYKYYTDILIPDKRVTIENMQSLTIESPSVKKFGIGLQIGYAFNPATSKLDPTIGVGISYNLIRF
jgi:hypothetical protein